jgi:hypothetical protein
MMIFVIEYEAGLKVGTAEVSVISRVRWQSLLTHRGPEMSFTG